MTSGRIRRPPGLTIQQLKNFLSRYRRAVIQETALVRAGVLVLLFEEHGGLSFLMTKRTEGVEHHKGQISFPGGAVDEQDPSIVDTALREAEEEVGLPRRSVETLGMLDDLATPSGFVITPVVGFAKFLSPLSLNPAEVSEVFHVPLEWMMDVAHEEKFKRERDGKLVELYRYRFEGHEIWGATAAIVRSFLKALRRDLRNRDKARESP